MKHMKPVFLLAFLFANPTLAAYTEVVNGIEWTYTVSGDTASVGSGMWSSPSISTATSGAIVIPEMLGNRPVTKIGSYAFYRCSGLTSITIPDSVTSIEDSVFSYCSGLTSITIPDSITSIEYRAFSFCSKLSSVIIPNSVTNIGEEAFYGCSRLSSITILNGITSIGNSAFSGCSGLTSITIPDSVTKIGAAAFSDCTSLASITIPDRVTIIDDGAFYNCIGLSSIIIPESVTSIGASAFDNCSGLTSVTIPASVTNLGWDVFYGCSSLNILYLPRRFNGTTDSLSIPSGCTVHFFDANPILSIASLFGCPSPNSGQVTCKEVTSISACVSPPEQENGVRHVCTGWTGTGSVPVRGTGTNVTFTILENSSITWNWRTDNLMTISVTGDAVRAFETTQWIEDGMTIMLEISPKTHLYTISLAGDTNGVTLAGTTLTIPSGGPRNILVTVTETKLALDVMTERGTPTPTDRTEWSWGKTVLANIAEPEPDDGWKFLCTGWTGTGSVPANGTGTNVTFTIEEDSSIVWNWATNVWLDCSATGFASVAFEPCWTNFGETVVIPFEPKDVGFSWMATGDSDGVVVDAAARTISIPADRPRMVRFAFSGTTRADAASGGGKPVEWTHGGDAEWFAEFADENDESGFLRSGEIGSSSNSWTEIAVKGPGRLDFDWRVSCNSRGHYAQVLVDDTQWKRITGTTDWTEETIEIGEGEHRIRWNYVKGTTSASGEDRACLDNVVWRPYVTLDIYSSEETNCVPRPGSYRYLWGETVEAHSAPTATYENERYVCSGWHRSKPVSLSGPETNVVFTIYENGYLRWSWEREVWMEIHTEGPVSVPFESGWTRQSLVGTSNETTTIEYGTLHTTYKIVAATNSLSVDLSVPRASFKLECEDLPTSTNHFPMIGSQIGTIGDLDPPPPEPVPDISRQMASTGEPSSELVDKTPFHRVVFDKRSNVLSFDCTHACRITLIATEMTLATALDTHGLDWTTSGADMWFPQDDMSSDGEDAAKSGTVQGDDASVLRTTVTGPGTLSWSWKLAMEGSAGVDVFLDDAPVDGLYDACDWTDHALEITGTGEHEVRFEFWNAGDAETITDCAYLDRMKWNGGMFEGMTETTPVPVPYEWLNGYPDLLDLFLHDYEATAWSGAANGANEVWQCYVAGLDPTSAASRLVATIDMVDGEPVVRWTPDLNEGGTKAERVYTVEGKTNLGDGSWGPTNEASRFFRVKVEMP